MTHEFLPTYHLWFMMESRVSDRPRPCLQVSLRQDSRVLVGRVRAGDGGSVL
jgi:hypothetical protein